MSEEKLKGGKADNKTVSDIAKKHRVSISDIKKELKAGIEIEKEHTDSEKERAEIAKDHIWEYEKYYTDPKNGLVKKEKEMNESKKMKALAGIEEADKKFLSNESFSEQDIDSSDETEFTTLTFEQREVEPGEDDDKLYKLG